MVEKDDHLSGTCGGEDFAERVQAKSEQRPSAATLRLDGIRMQARHGDTGFDGERHGESHEREQGAQFVRVVASSAKPLVLRLPNMVSMVQRWR